jgi:hypothetical protein
VSEIYETSDVDRMAYISSMFDVKKFETIYYHKLLFNSKDSLHVLGVKKTVLL